MSRISVIAGNVVTFGDGSQEVFDTGSPTANKIADIIGECGGVLFNSEAGVKGVVGMIKGIKGFQGFLARKIENLGNSATTYSFENMTQYIRSVLYGQHQFASTNGMGTINAGEDLFKFSKIEGNAANEAKTVGNSIEAGSYSWKAGYEIDKRYLGTGNIGDFSNLEGKTIPEVLSRVPKDSTRRELIPEIGKVIEGFEYKWVKDGKTYRVRIHGIDESAPSGSNAANGWIVQILMKN